MTAIKAAPFGVTCPERPWKGIAHHVLLDAGVQFHANGSVTIPYRRADGSLHRVRLYKGNRALWLGGESLVPLGLELLPPIADRLDKAVFITEGESDCFAFREAYAEVIGPGWPTAFYAIGVPGVNAWRDEWANALVGFGTVYAAGDGDLAGRRFNNAIHRAIPYSTYLLLPPGEDARSIMTKGGVRAFDDVIERSERAAALWLALTT